MLSCIIEEKNHIQLLKLYIPNIIQKKQQISILDVSLPAVCFYENRGYKTVEQGIYELENDVKLVYEIMEKKFRVD